MEGIGLYVLIGLAVVVLWLFFYFVPVGLWVSALAAGVPVGPVTFIGMRLRKVNPHRVIMPMIAAWKAGIKLTTSELEAHYLAGGTWNGWCGPSSRPTRRGSPWASNGRRPSTSPEGTSTTRWR